MKSVLYPYQLSHTTICFYLISFQLNNHSLRPFQIWRFFFFFFFFLQKNHPVWIKGRYWENAYKKSKDRRLYFCKIIGSIFFLL